MRTSERRFQGGGRRAAIAVVAAASAVIAVTYAARGEMRPGPDWRTVSAVAFPAHARTVLDGEIGPELVTALAGELGGEPEQASRAAVLLGGVIANEDVDPEVRGSAARALVERLSARKAAGNRYAVGVDVVAARALDEWAKNDTGVARAMTSLAVGIEPHPDLPVRVECASVALQAGERDGVVPFLLAVLRAETPAERVSERSWERVTTLAWVKTRAAEALSLEAGTEMRFRPDGSWAHQVAEAERLEGLVRER